jgi:hypothetical protein
LTWSLRIAPLPDRASNLVGNHFVEDRHRTAASQQKSGFTASRMYTIFAYFIGRFVSRNV